MAGKRVLIVEDEPVIGFALEDMLDSLGWETIGVASRVQEALDLIRSDAPDTAILDVNLHGEKSYPVADLLADREIPYIFATGYGDSEHPPRHKQITTLTKPYSIEQIRAALPRTGELD